MFKDIKQAYKEYEYFANAAKDLKEMVKDSFEEKGVVIDVLDRWNGETFNISIFFKESTDTQLWIGLIMYTYSASDGLYTTIDLTDKAMELKVDLAISEFYQSVQILARTRRIAEGQQNE